mmetsp:Transcript_104211/g.248026  ORF Transcript_104211/g.248026 Transcript_104211/m.248026 type:complete len:210 (-) Transcript_104211:316-945(-)
MSHPHLLTVFHLNRLAGPSLTPTDLDPKLDKTKLPSCSQALLALLPRRGPGLHRSEAPLLPPLLPGAPQPSAWPASPRLPPAAPQAHGASNSEVELLYLQSLLGLPPPQTHLRRFGLGCPRRPLRQALADAKQPSPHEWSRAQGCNHSRLRLAALLGCPRDPSSPSRSPAPSELLPKKAMRLLQSQELAPWTVSSRRSAGWQRPPRQSL